MELKTELKQASKQRYRDFVEESAVVADNSKKMRVIFNNLSVAKKFFDVLKGCSICDIRDLTIDGKTLHFFAGSCSSTDSMVRNIEIKLDGVVK